ncbi:MAG: hypothetical protein AB1414_04300 [bacterium]
MRKSQIIVGIIFQIGIICVLSYATTGSINPLKVYSAENTVIRTIAYVLTGLVGLALLGLFAVRVGIPEDATCAYCGKNIRDLLGAAGYGNPRPCPTCLRFGERTFYHGVCWKAIHGKCIVCSERYDTNSYDRY